MYLNKFLKILSQLAICFIAPHVLCMYKFSNDVIFADDQNPGSFFINPYILCSICIVIVLKILKDLILMDDKLSTKTTKLTFLESCAYTVFGCLSTAVAALDSIYRGPMALRLPLL